MSTELFIPRSVNARKFKPTRATVNPVVCSITHWVCSIEQKHHIIPKEWNLLSYIQHTRLSFPTANITFKPLLYAE